MTARQLPGGDSHAGESCQARAYKGLDANQWKRRKNPRAPNCRVVLRRFMAGESVESMAWRETVLEFRASGGRFLIHEMIRPAYRRIVEYEDALRRAMLRQEKARRR